VVHQEGSISGVECDIYDCLNWKILRCSTEIKPNNAQGTYCNFDTIIMSKTALRHTHMKYPFVSWHTINIAFITHFNTPQNMSSYAKCIHQKYLMWHALWHKTLGREYFLGWGCWYTVSCHLRTYNIRKIKLFTCINNNKVKLFRNICWNQSTIT